MTDVTTDEMVEHATGSRGIRKRSSRFLAPEQIPRFHCDFCKRDISRKIRIKCADCCDFDLCVECFAVGVEYQEHKKTHRYRVIDDLSFAVFSSSWGADEEILFFDGICKYGPSNWEAVSNLVGSKSSDACRQHYMEVLPSAQAILSLDQLIEKQQWVDEEVEVVPLTAKDVSPIDFDSDDFGSTPRSLSPASSLALSDSSMSLDCSSDNEWIVSPSVESSKSSLHEGLPDASGPISDAEMAMTETGGGTEAAGSDAESKVEKEDQIGKKSRPGIGIHGTCLVDPAGTYSLMDTPGGDKSPGKKQVGGRPRRSLSLFDTNAGDVTGYNPFRKEFDPPYDVAAEMMIADLEFFEDDPDDVRKAKVKLLHLYRWRVYQREKRSEVLKKNAHQLMDVKKIMAMEKSWGTNEMFSDLRPFARWLFVSQVKFSSLGRVDRLVKGMCVERTIRRRIQELQEARALGCRTFMDIRAKSKDLKSSRPIEKTSVQQIGKWRRLHADISEGSDSKSSPELNERERAFCLDVGFSPWQYAVLRDRLVREAEEYGKRFSRTLVRTFFRLDSNLSTKLFDFLVSEGKMVNSDKESKEVRKVVVKKEEQVDAPDEPI